jgi:hypothetical protein
LLILSVFSGCNLQMTMLPNNTKPTATKPVISTEPTEPAETTKPTEATKPTQSIRPSQPSVDSARPLEMPEDTPSIINGIYVSSPNYYYTLYVGNWTGMRRYEDIYIYLMSEDPLPGDTIVTIGGFTGKVLSIKDDEVTFETGAAKTRLTIKKWAIQSREGAAVESDKETEESK